MTMRSASLDKPWAVLETACPWALQLAPIGGYRPWSAKNVPLPDAFHRRFVIVSGKGGVGKSTLAAAIGLRSAKEGRRTCIVQLNTRDAIGPIFATHGEVGYQPTRLDPTLPLWSVDLRPGPALREYGVMKLRFRSLHKLVFENDVMRRLLGMVPGMTETLLLGKAWFMEAIERDESGSLRWDTLIIDAPSTGHGISLLRLPQVLLSVVPVGPMADDARQMAALLADPARTAFHIATLPAELPVNEALDLEAHARDLIGIPTGSMLVNQLLDPAGDAASVAQIPPLLKRLDAAEVDAGPMAAALGDIRHNWQAAERSRDGKGVQLARLEAATALPIVRLPHLLGRVDRAGLDRLGDVLANSGTSPGTAAQAVSGVGVSR